MISNQVACLKGSPTMKYFALAKKREAEGHHIIHLEIGQPDFQPLKPIIETTIQAIKEGKTNYTISAGIHELRQTISRAYHEDYSLRLDPTEVVVTSGAKQALFAAIYSILDRGDVLIVPEPRWVSYPDMATLTGLKYVPISMIPDFSLNQEEILSQIKKDKKTAIVVNSPNNPSGHILSPKEIKFLQDLVEDYNIFIISDEIYNEYVFIDSKFRTLLTEFENWRENLIIVNGFSKTFSMTGYRLGYVISHSKIIKEGILKIIQASTTCPTNFCQWAGVTAIEKRNEARKLIEQIFPKRREILLNEIKEIDGLSVGSIDGAFYGFMKYSFTNKSSAEVTEDILTNANVSLVPGSAFGESAEGYLRVTFSRSIPEIKEAFSRIRKFLDQ